MFAMNHPFNVRWMHNQAYSWKILGDFHAHETWIFNWTLFSLSLIYEHKYFNVFISTITILI